MTRLPSESWQVSSLRGGDYKTYRVSERCCHPTCTQWADHVHHLWRRSFVGGDVAWVRLDFEDPPVVVGNLAGLCHGHHYDITTNRADIVWQDAGFCWSDATTFGPLDPQPPVRVSAAATGPSPDPSGSAGSADAHSHAEDIFCPTCKRRKRVPLPDLPAGEKRKRKSWNLTVPDDAEDGALVLDVLCDELSELFGHDEYATKLRRYYTVVQAFTLVLQNQHLITEDA